MLTVILINVLTIALLWSWLLSLHVQNDPIHHLSDPYIQICGMCSGSHWSPVSRFTSRLARTPIKVYLKRRFMSYLYVCALIKFIGSPTSVTKKIHGNPSETSRHVPKYVLAGLDIYLDLFEITDNTNLPFSFVMRGPPESPKHIIPFSCPVTLPNAHKCVFCIL